MPDILKILFFLVIIPYQLRSQILPVEGSSLNYRIIGFSVRRQQKVTNYKFVIAAGNYNTAGSFNSNIIKSVSNRNNKIIAEVPSFGSQYTWQVIYDPGKSTETTSELYHFSTGYVKEIDTGEFRLRVLTPAAAFNSAYVFLDGNKVLYDMKGKPVWYLPLINGQNCSAADLRLTPQGTITFLSGHDAYEINYDGRVLWKGPNDGTVNGDKQEFYHHEFTRLANGHYMLLGLERMDLPASGHAIVSPAGRSRHNRHFRFGTIIEYDKKGNVVWSWKAKKYFMRQEALNKSSADTIPPDAHENAFYFDEKNKIIYLSCKHISRIIKIKYPEGTVLANYSGTYTTGASGKDSVLFCGQHSVRRSAQGYLYLFNNNTCSMGEPPVIEKLKEPVSKNAPLKLIWDYHCTLDDTAAIKANPRMFSFGGDVFELHDHSLFVCMGGEYSKVFIVNPAKKILWSAVPEAYQGNRQWTNILQYRASIIENSKDLEKLIWNSERRSDLAK